MNPYLLISIETGPVVLERLLLMLPESAWGVREDPERFSPREVIAHMADWEPVFLDRMRLALKSPGATFEAYDEGVWAVEHGYSASDLNEQMALLKARRAETAAFVRGLKQEDYDLVVVHPEMGARSVGDMAHMLLGHDLYHIEQILGAVEKAKTADE